MTADTAVETGPLSEVDLAEAKRIIETLDEYDVATILDTLTDMGVDVPSPDETDLDARGMLNKLVDENPQAVYEATLVVVLSLYLAGAVQF